MTFKNFLCRGLSSRANIEPQILKILGFGESQTYTEKLSNLNSVPSANNLATTLTK